MTLSLCAIGVECILRTVAMEGSIPAQMSAFRMMISIHPLTKNDIHFVVPPIELPHLRHLYERDPTGNAAAAAGIGPRESEISDQDEKTKTKQTFGRFFFV